MNLWGIERSHSKGPTLDMSLVWLQCQHNMALWQFKKSRLLNSYPSSPFCDLFLALCLPCHWNLQKEGGQYNMLNICKAQIANIDQIWLKALIVLVYNGFATRRWLQSHLRRKQMDFLRLQSLSWPWTPRGGEAIYRLKNVKKLKIEFFVFFFTFPNTNPHSGFWL